MREPPHTATRPRSLKSSCATLRPDFIGHGHAGFAERQRLEIAPAPHQGGQVHPASEHSYPLADRTDLPRVAQYLAVTYDSMFPKEELANSFKKCAPPDFSARDEPHSVLSKLPLPIYMTTNYDDFMIRALKAQGREGVRETCRWKSDIKHLPSEFEKGYVPSAQQPVVFHL